MDGLLAVDQQLLIWINSTWSNTVFDLVLPNITDLHKNEIFVALFLTISVSCSYYFYRWNGLLVYFIGLLSVGISDLIGGKIIKPLFERMRPSQEITEIILRSPHFGGYSFTSNHAANIFCAAAFFSGFYPRLRIYFFTYAAMVAYSRVYVGVHFPSDVIIGGIWGGLVGWLMARALQMKIKPMAVRHG